MERRIESVEALQSVQSVGHRIARKESKVDARLRREWADVLREHMDEENNRQEQQEQEEEQQLKSFVEETTPEEAPEQAPAEDEATQRARMQFVRAHPNDLISAHLLGAGISSTPGPIGHWVDSEV